MAWIFVGGVVVIFLIVVIVIAGQARRSQGDRGQIGQGFASPGDMEEFACQNCGAELSRQHITLEGRNYFVSCPYCDSEYRIRER